MQSPVDPDVLKALDAFLHSLVEMFGPWGAVAILALVVATPIVLRVRKERREDRRAKEYRDAQRAQVQTLREENAMWRRFFFEQQGLTPEQADYVLGPNSAAPRRLVVSERPEWERDDDEE
jgi:flagellar biosynthesis/type III secretory pathway M-ring protein FliF/YscJ